MAEKELPAWVALGKCWSELEVARDLNPEGITNTEIALQTAASISQVHYLNIRDNSADMASKKIFMYVEFPLRIICWTCWYYQSTGATGYIGGSVLEAIIQKYAELDITALLRTPSSEFRNRYSKVDIVVGDFDAFDVIEKASLAADIVIRK